MIFRTRLTQHEQIPSPWAYVLLWAFAIILSPRLCNALDPEAIPSQYLYASWQDQLPQNTVQAILQTRDGYLWLGTQGGLVRFDGIRFVEIPLAGEEAMAVDVRALFEGADGTLWVGTRGNGLLQHRGGSLEPVGRGYPPDPGDGPLSAAGPTVVFALAQDPTGALWLGTRSRGVVRFTKGRFEALAAEVDLSSERILSLLVDRQGQVWAGTSEGGLARIEDETLEAFGREQIDDGILSLFEDRKGTLWIGTRRSGLFRLDPAPNAVPIHVEEIGSEAIMALTDDHHGNLWLATYGRGLLRISAENNAQGIADTDAGLSSNAVMAVFEDREGNLWAGTEGGGLNQLRDGTLRTFGIPEGLLAEQVWTILEDRQGILWIGTDGGGLGRLEDGHITNLTTEDGLSSNSLTALLEDRGGDLWVGSRGQGLNRLRGGRVEVFDRDDGLTNPSVFAMTQDDEGTLWLGTPASGLNRSRGRRFEKVEVPGPAGVDLADDLILALAHHPDGRLVLATDSGLKLLGEQGMTVLTTADGLSADTLFSLYIDPQGTIWAGTYGAGLNRIRDGQITTYGRREGFPSDAILQILEDDLGFFWMGSNQGIFRTARSELEALARGEITSVTSQLFGKADGMRSAECNGGYQPSGWKDRSGRLWFPTIRGVVVIDPAQLHSNPVPPGLVVESLLVDGEPADTRTELVFAPGRKRFEIAYTALSFSDPERVRFRYRLEGYDNDWVEAGGQRQATYTNLPGDRRYRFQVIAANEDGVWNEEGAGISFSVQPFLYQRRSFRIGAVLAFALLVWSAYKLRLRQLLRRTEHLESLVNDRTQEVVEQRDKLRSANQELIRLNDFKSEFLGIAAHDLKNPLSIIYGYAGSIAREAEESPRLVRVAQRISTSANQMLNIVSDLLDTTALESGRLRFDLEPLDLSALVLDILDRFQVTAAQRQIELRPVELSSVQVVGDREKLIRVCENLISNAIRYTAQETAVEIRLDKIGTPAGDRVQLRVEDHGPGLTEQQVQRIFSRFERLAEKHQVVRHSAGLGLSIVKQFVEMHDGRVWVESVPKEGSTFIVELPVAGPAVDSEEDSGSRESDQDGPSALSR